MTSVKTMCAIVPIPQLPQPSPNRATQYVSMPYDIGHSVHAVLCTHKVHTQKTFFLPQTSEAFRNSSPIR